MLARHSTQEQDSGARGSNAVKDVDLPRRVITVRNGKGGKDRTTLLPCTLHMLVLAGVYRTDGTIAERFVPLSAPSAAERIGLRHSSRSLPFRLST
jgi:hypothetical protein